MNSSIYKIIACVCVCLCISLAFVSCNAPPIILPEANAGNGANNGQGNGSEGNGNGSGNSSGNDTNTHTHSYTQTVTEPTCVSAGYVTSSCSCGDKKLSNYSDALGHKYLAPEYIAEEGKTICVNGGKCIITCERCGASDESEVDPIGHDVSTWSIAAEATQNENGAIYGTCKECKGVIEVKLPKLDVVKYNYSEQLTVASCNNKKGIGIYTVFVDSRGNLTSDEAAGLQKISISIDVSGSIPHILKGNLMTNETYPNSYNGVVEFSEAKATCTQNGTGYFICDSCGDVVLVYTTKSHTFEGSATVVVAPKCDVGGTNRSYCSECKSYISYGVPALGHDYVTEFISDDNNSLAFAVSCSRCTFTDTFITDEYVRAVTAATCRDNGSISYSVEVYGKSVEVIRSIPRVGHSLNGFEFDSTLAYDPDVYGITEFSDHVSTCTVSGKGHYECDYCKEIQMINTLRSHKGSMSVVTEPDCENDGSGVIDCTVCGNRTTEKLPALGHSYECELVSVDESLIVIDATCTVCEASTRIQSDDYRSVTSDATCLVHGSITYYVKHETSTYTVTVETAKSFHKLGEIFIDPSAVYYPGDGIVEFAGYESTESSSGKGYYICDVCGELQMVITKYKEEQ